MIPNLGRPWNPLCENKWREPLKPSSWGPTISSVEVQSGYRLVGLSLGTGCPDTQETLGIRASERDSSYLGDIRKPYLSELVRETQAI